jgi:hypothetical protein
MRTTKALQMLETSVVRMYGDDLDMAAATSSLYAAFSEVRGDPVVRFVDIALERAIDDLLPLFPDYDHSYHHHTRNSLSPAGSVILVKALAPTNQILILPQVSPITAALCAIARDANRAVRDTGVAGLHAILSVCANERLPNGVTLSAPTYLEEVFEIMTRTSQRARPGTRPRLLPLPVIRV